ncbi:MAG: hypothetical protein K0Q79_619 [Flavipsychrobacter sp.]|jgi:hypothetical protein|nr:hypothetical protein [Flavipsychrobacter sp.]
MIKKMSRKKALEDFPKFPTSNFVTNEYYYPKSFKDHTLTLEAKSVKSHIRQLSNEIIKFAEKCDVKDLIFIGDSSIPWRKFVNDYKPAKEADVFLESNSIGRRFNGAILVEEKDLNAFIKNLFWLTRCNSAFPTIYFSDKEQNFLGNICKYGNLHLSILNKKTDSAFKVFLKTSSFTILAGTMCFEQFSETGAIKGRKLNI